MEEGAVGGRAGHRARCRWGSRQRDAGPTFPPTHSHALHADFTRVLELDPSNFNAAFARAAAHNRRGAFAEAIEDYALALTADAEARRQHAGRTGGAGGTRRAGHGASAAGGGAGAHSGGGGGASGSSGGGGSSSSLGLAAALGGRPTAGFGLGAFLADSVLAGRLDGLAGGGAGGGPRVQPDPVAGSAVPPAHDSAGAGSGGTTGAPRSDDGDAAGPAIRRSRQGSFRVGVDEFLRERQAHHRAAAAAAVGASGPISLSSGSQRSGSAGFPAPASSSSMSSAGGGRGGTSSPVSADEDDDDDDVAPRVPPPGRGGDTMRGRHHDDVHSGAYPTSQASPTTAQRRHHRSVAVASAAAAAVVAAGPGFASPPPAGGGMLAHAAPPTVYAPRMDPATGRGVGPSAAAAATAPASGAGGDAADAVAAPLSFEPPSSRSASADADAHHARGFALRRRGDFAGAIAEYSRAISADPRHFKALFNRGFAHDKLRDFPAAITGACGWAGARALMGGSACRHKPTSALICCVPTPHRPPPTPACRLHRCAGH